MTASPVDPLPSGLRRAVHARVGGLPGPFWWVWAGLLVNRIGTFVEPFLLLWLVGERQLTTTQAGLAATAYGAGALVSQPVGGVLADRVGRRETLLAGMLASGAALLALGASSSLLMIAAAAAVVGLVGDLYRPAASALVADVVDPADRARAFGLNFWAINLGFSVATVAAGVLVSKGWTLLFVLDAATCVALGLLTWYGTRGLPRHPRAAPGAGSGGMLAVLRDRLLVLVAILTALYAVVYLQAYTSLPLVMREDGLTPAQYGAALAVNGVAIVVVQPLVVNLVNRLPRGPVLASSVALVGLGFGLTAFASSVVAYGACVLVWTLGEIGVAGLLVALVADLAPPHLRGRYQGVFGLAFGVAGALAPLLGTRVLTAFGSSTLWAACAAVSAVAAAGLLVAARAAQRRVPGAGPAPARAGRIEAQP